MTNIAAIDPGLSGAIAVLDPDGNLIHAERLPVLKHGSGELVDARQLAQTLRTHNVVHTVIENVATRPGQGIASNGTFMRAVGVVYGVAAVHGSVSWVTPPVWKRHHGLIGQDKEASRVLAIALFARQFDQFMPKRKVRTLKQCRDLSDAALIAKWYVQTGGRTLSQLKKTAGLRTQPARSPSSPPSPDEDVIRFDF